MEEKKVENDEKNNNKKQRKEDNVRKLVKLNETREHTKEDEAAEQ